MIYANITITDVIPYRLVGVYDNSGTWTQASGVNFATHLALLNAVPTTTGSKAGRIYATGETLYAPDTDINTEVTFKPDSVGTFTGTITTDSNATAEDSSTVTGLCVNQFDVERIDHSTLKNNILQQYRR